MCWSGAGSYGVGRARELGLGRFNRLSRPPTLPVLAIRASRDKTYRRLCAGAMRVRHQRAFAPNTRRDLIRPWGLRTGVYATVERVSSRCDLTLAAEACSLEDRATRRPSGEPYGSTSYGSPMGWLEFVTKIVGSIAWPAAGGVAAWKLKDPLGKLLKDGRISEAEVGTSGLKFKAVYDEQFSRTQTRVTESATIDHSTDLPPVPPDADYERHTAVAPGSDEEGDLAEAILLFDPALASYRISETDLYEVAAVSPSAAVVASFQPVENAVAELANMLGYADSKNVAFVVNLRRVARSHTLDSRTIDALEQLANLRNLATHSGSDPGAQRAVDFVKLSATVLSVLQSHPGRRYEAAVRAALERVTRSDGRIEEQPGASDLGVDAMWRADGGPAVVIESKFSRTGDLAITSAMLKNLGASYPAVFVSNVAVKASIQSGLLPSVRTVVWRSPKDDALLQQALDAQKALARQRKPDDTHDPTDL
jgi:hypothetical protein